MTKRQDASSQLNWEENCLVHKTAWVKSENCNDLYLKKKKNEVSSNYMYENKNVLQNETLAISVPF